MLSNEGDWNNRHSAEANGMRIGLIDFIVAFLAVVVVMGLPWWI